MSSHVEKLKEASDKLSNKMRELKAFNVEAEERAKIDLTLAWHELISTVEALLQSSVDARIVTANSVAEMRNSLIVIRDSKNTTKDSLVRLDAVARAALRMLSWEMPTPKPSWFMDAMETIHRSAQNMRYAASRL